MAHPQDIKFQKAKKFFGEEIDSIMAEAVGEMENDLWIELHKAVENNDYLIIGKIIGDQMTAYCGDAMDSLKR